MMILINVAAAAITVILAVSSGQNMLQTVEVSRQVHASKDDTPSFLLERFKIQPSESTENIVNQLHSFKRKELLELYLQSTAPIDVMEIQGEWDGDLLDNNSMIMTRVTAFLTNRLFGRGRKWNGKQFGTANDQDTGINRFYPRKWKSSWGISDSNVEIEHKFDMTIGTSKLRRRKGESSLILNYTAHQSPISLWRTMMDEIRILPLDGDIRVLIGLGYMAWSGGKLNASPFVLYQKPSPHVSSVSKSQL